MAHHRICPRCTSWRVEGVETASFGNRLLRIVNLRLYSCRDCGWQGIARAKEKRQFIKVLLRPSAWKYTLSGFLILVGLYAASNILIPLIGQEASQKPAGPPATAAKAGPESAPVLPTPNLSADAAPLPAPRVVGNSDSKRYHLPGMKYYHRVEAHHRVEFSSEEEAIAAGYHKAPR